MKNHTYITGLSILFILVAVVMHQFLAELGFASVIISGIFSAIICLVLNKLLSFVDGYLYLSKQRSMVFIVKDGKLLLTFSGSSIDDLPNNKMIIDIAQDSAKGISKYEISVIQSSYKEVCGLLETPRLPVVDFKTSLSKRLLSSLQEL